MDAVKQAKMGEIEKEPVRPKITDVKGILQQNREFLDFFWDIAKPEQQIRLKAIEDLVQYLKLSEKPDEITYSLKRLVDGLAHTREVARPGFSLALGQVLGAFEEVPLRTTFDQIKLKHNLQTAKKKLIRSAAFGNLFGVLALSQSNRLSKEPLVVLECVQLLQSLSQHREHLKDLPTKTMVDILSETPQEVFEEVLLGALQGDLSSAFSTPEQLQLLLVAMQKFPEVLKPKKLKKLLGTSTIITTANIPKVTEVLRMAARSMKKDHLLPGVALDLLQVSLREDNFELFWEEIIIKGMLKDPQGHTQYLCYRLLGSALPLLSLLQLKQVLSGEVMRHYGEHVVSVQLQDRFKFGPVMETYVGDFFQACDDSDKQLAVLLGFSLLTNQGYPVVPSGWRVVQYLQPPTLRSYIDWLKKMFLHPQLETCLDFATRKQKENQEEQKQKEDPVIRLRKWIIPRLTSIIENCQVKRDEELVMDVARFVFFHAFFNIKKATPCIPETQNPLSVPLDDKSRTILVNSFFGLLQHMNNMSVLGESPEGVDSSHKRFQGVTADGTMWIYHIVQFADALLNQPKNVQSNQPFSPDQREAWNSMISSVATLMKKAKKEPAPETNAFQQLFLLVGIHLFKAPEDLVDLMKDLQNCMEKAQEKKVKKKKKKKQTEEEPHWAEVVVDILLSLLAQPSRHIRQVCKTVFAHICPHVTARALNAILDVLDPHKDEEESVIAVTDDKDKEDKTKKGKAKQEEEDQEEDQDEDMQEEDESGSDDDSDEEADEDLAMEEGGEEVDQNFRLELMKVLQNQNALATEEDGSDAEDLDDEAMMKLDGSIAALFLEQKKKIQAKKDEKVQMKKETALIRDFKIKVLDLIEVFLAKQANSPLVLGLVEPLLTVIETSMSSESDQQEQDFLRRAADIFRNQLCRAKLFCKTVADRQAELHDLLERLMDKAQKQTDSSVSLYFFSASVYLVKVLRGGVPVVEGKADKKIIDAAAVEKLKFMGNVDVERVTTIFKEALCSFMTKRNSPLPGQMFTDLFTRFPVLCVNLLDTAVENITSGVREHQQSQACFMVLKGIQSREVQQLLAGNAWVEMCTKAVDKLASTLEPVVESQKRVVQEKVVKALELCLFLVKNIQNQKLTVSLDRLQMVLESMTKMMSFRNTGQLEDTYWTVMKQFGILKPKFKQTKLPNDEHQQSAVKKTKGFLPETKKRKNRKKQVPVSEKGVANTTPSLDKSVGEGQGKKKKNKTKRKQSGGEVPLQPSPAKKAKTQPPGKGLQKKKSKKQGDGD
ncbi:myb-binding protein 1A-like protein [Aplochiton taeniatus]